jgi:hypothetical protein
MLVRPGRNLPALDLIYNLRIHYTMEAAYKGILVPKASESAEVTDCHNTDRLLYPMPL